MPFLLPVLLIEWNCLAGSYICMHFLPLVRFWQVFFFFFLGGGGGDRSECSLLFFCIQSMGTRIKFCHSVCIVKALNIEKQKICESKIFQEGL